MTRLWKGPADDCYLEGIKFSWDKQKVFLPCDVPIPAVRFIQYQLGTRGEESATIQWLEVFHFVTGKYAKDWGMAIVLIIL